jgi:hypothetical protein
MVKAIVARPSGLPRSGKKQAGIPLVDAGGSRIAWEPVGLRTDLLRRWENGSPAS